MRKPGWEGRAEHGRAWAGPAALGNYGEEVADPQRTPHRGGSSGPCRSRSRDRNLGWLGPTPLTCADRKHPRSPEARTVKVTP
ncbi:hypothetical protein MC885_014933 [Smutsia gigantea]|nr:hypothetical protein MC885_014933 [Smutsia gigantea]